jgi:hypothetical protein
MWYGLLADLVVAIHLGYVTMWWLVSSLFC